MTTTHITRADLFFVEKLNASNLQYINFDSFHVWFVHSKNPRKLEAVFTFWQTKNHDQMQCQKKSITSRSENSETFIKQCANAND